MTSSKRNSKVMVIGIARLWAGILNPAKGLKERGLDTVYYYLERKKEFTREGTGFDVATCPSSPLLATWKLGRLLKKHQPRHVDVYYHTGKWKSLVKQCWLLERRGIPMVSVCTGAELLNFEEHGLKQVEAMRTCFKLSSAIVIKELYMEEVIRKHKLAPLEKVHFCSNKIQVGPRPSFERECKTILFLNLFKEFRRIDLLIDAMPAILKEVPDARLLLVGEGRYPEREAALRKQIDDLGLQEHVEVEPYTNEPKPYFQRASVFALPADIVFCNNALLEAMEQGVPPVVAAVDGSDRIVVENESGLIVKQDATANAEAIIGLLKDEAERRRLAEGARARIESEFSEAARAEFLHSLYEKSVW